MPHRWEFERLGWAIGHWCSRIRELLWPPAPCLSPAARACYLIFGKVPRLAAMYPPPPATPPLHPDTTAPPPTPNTQHQTHTTNQQTQSRYNPTTNPKQPPNPNPTTTPPTQPQPLCGVLGCGGDGLFGLGCGALASMIFLCFLCPVCVGGLRRHRESEDANVVCWESYVEVGVR